MLILLVIGIIVFLTVGYFLLMFIYPEWVGISGEDTKKTIEAHQYKTPSQESIKPENTQEKSPVGKNQNSQS
jgi:hypothetical protein